MTVVKIWKERGFLRKIPTTLTVHKEETIPLPFTELLQKCKGSQKEGLATFGTPLQCSCLENHMDRGGWWAVVHGVAESRAWLSDFTFTFHFHALEKEMATRSTVLAWRIPGTGEPGGLPSGRTWLTQLSSSTTSHLYFCCKTKWTPPADVWKHLPLPWESSPLAFNDTVGSTERPGAVPFPWVPLIDSVNNTHWL